MTKDQEAFVLARASLKAGGSIMVSQNDEDLFPPGDTTPRTQDGDYFFSPGGSAPDPLQLRSALEELIARDRDDFRDLGVPLVDVDDDLRTAVASWNRKSKRYKYSFDEALSNAGEYRRIVPQSQRGLGDFPNTPSEL